MTCKVNSCSVLSVTGLSIVLSSVFNVTLIALCLKFDFVIFLLSAFVLQFLHDAVG